MFLSGKNWQRHLASKFNCKPYIQILIPGLLTNMDVRDRTDKIGTLLAWFNQQPSGQIEVSCFKLRKLLEHLHAKCCYKIRPLKLVSLPCCSRFKEMEMCARCLSRLSPVSRNSRKKNLRCSTLSSPSRLVCPLYRKIFPSVVEKEI